MTLNDNLKQLGFCALAQPRAGINVFDFFGYLQKECKINTSEIQEYKLTFTEFCTIDKFEVKLVEGYQVRGAENPEAVDDWIEIGF
jgi:hypothetical protein